MSVVHREVAFELIFLCSETEQREIPYSERSLYAPGPPDLDMCVCSHALSTSCIYVVIVCVCDMSAFRALSFGQNKLFSHGMWLLLLRQDGLVFSALRLLYPGTLWRPLRSRDIDGMLVTGTLGLFCRFLGITGHGPCRVQVRCHVKGHSVLDVGSGATLLTGFGLLR